MAASRWCCAGAQCSTLALAANCETTVSPRNNCCHPAIDPSNTRGCPRQSSFNNSTISALFAFCVRHLTRRAVLPTLLRYVKGKAIYTTNAIESLNSVTSSATKRRKLFPSDESALKVIYLAISQAAKNRLCQFKIGVWRLAFGVWR